MSHDFQPRTVQLDPKTWGRGNTGGNIYCHDTGRHCVIGAMLKTVGKLDESPNGDHDGRSQPKWSDEEALFGCEGASVVTNLMDINDDSSYTDEERVARFNEQGEQWGWQYVLASEVDGR